MFLWEQGRQLPGPRDVVVVDEAGMIGSRQMERLLHFTQAGRAKLVLVGDARQLQAIEAGGAFRAIADRIGTAAIKTVRRQAVEWQRQATGELATGQTEAALARYEAASMVHGHATDAAAQAALVDAWHRHRVEQPGQTQLIMAFLHRDVAALNALARGRLRADGALGPDVGLSTATGRECFSVHDRLYFTRNDAKLGVRNGSIATIEAIHGRSLTVRLDGASVSLTFSLDHYGHIAHGYAATIHKSQGATVDRAHLYCSANLDQHAAYVAMTRHRERLDLHWSRQSIPTRQRLTAILSRLSMKDTSLDYADERVAEAEARQDVFDETQVRIRARVQIFADREATAAGRMANARALLPADATTRDLARLALNTVERARLFGLRQGRLHQWARGIVPAACIAVAQPIRTTRTAIHAARLEHSHAVMEQLQVIEARHAAARRQEQAARRALQREAAENWHRLAVTTRVTARFAGQGCSVVAFQAAASPAPAKGDLSPPLLRIA
ncbi:AAA family ATPase [Lichenihabitans sp. Uapishka_5]|uniref:AAA family ATPase n=1 Tax=Lichenihabitans sp. Uapishka_5 TaxID=3037302 RepID=UPI0029E7E179|nr:AAA family ATPase [Lichenihabitans sp. Uapishka_5]MDX7951801.1 AAA family ATPase [Lichenihabitans sp. Uapishka_5]